MSVVSLPQKVASSWSSVSICWQKEGVSLESLLCVPWGGQAGIGIILSVQELTPLPVLAQAVPCQDSPVSPWATGTQVCLFCLEGPLRQIPRACGIQGEGRSWGV